MARLEFKRRRRSASVPTALAVLGILGVIFAAEAAKMTPMRGLKRSIEDLRVVSHIKRQNLER